MVYRGLEFLFPTLTHISRMILDFNSLSRFLKFYVGKLCIGGTAMKGVALGRTKDDIQHSFILAVWLQMRFQKFYNAIYLGVAQPLPTELVALLPPEVDKIQQPFKARPRQY